MGGGDIGAKCADFRLASAELHEKNENVGARSTLWANVRVRTAARTEFSLGPPLR
jgi:hypothetical protein